MVLPPLRGFCSLRGRRHHGSGGGRGDGDGSLLQNTSYVQTSLFEGLTHTSPFPCRTNQSLNEPQFVEKIAEQRDFPV